MAVSYSRVNGQYYSDLTHSYYPDAGSAHAAEAAIPPAPAAGGSGTYDTGVTYDKAYADVQAQLDPNSPSYRGPGYVAGTDPKTGQPTLVNQGNTNSNQFSPTAQAAQVSAQNGAGAGAAPQTPLPTAAEALNAARAATGTQGTAPLPASRVAAPNGLPVGSLPAQRNLAPGPALPGIAGNVDLTGVSAAKLGQVAAGTPPGAPPATPASTPPPAAPTVDDSKVQPLLAGIGQYAAQIAALGQDTTGLTTALAQLASSSQAAQSGALGIARSGNRRDQGQLERQATGEIAFTGQQSARDAALLRATDAEADRKFRLDALNTAAGLGLNTGALQVDIGKANLGAATSYFNDQFQQLGIDKQITEQQSQALLGFTKDMASLQYQYDALSNEDQQAVLNREMQKWQVNTQDAAALNLLKQQRKVNWDQILTNAVGGLISGATSAGAHALLSDERTKTDVSDTTDSDLEELLSTFRSKKFRYKKEFGGMAQDLERSRLGSAMVSKHQSGLLQVDGARAGVAALSGLSFVFKRLQALEAAL